MINRYLDEINYLYKPSKYTIKGKTLIIETKDKNRYVIKESNEKLNNTYAYLNSRGFNYYLKPLDNNINNSYNIFPYVEENNIPYEQKANDLSKTVGLLHSKTSYHKEVDANKFDNIYSDISNNLLYLENYYSNMYDEIFIKEEFNPFDYLFMDYYSKISNEISFCKKELDSWYLLVGDKKTTRVSTVHNNLEVGHMLFGDDNYLISFDNSSIDTPVLDLYKFYKKEYMNIDFSSWFKNYLYYNELNEEELKFFFILIAIPDELKITDDNFENVKMITNLINYINKTEDLIRPYYFDDHEEE